MDGEQLLLIQAFENLRSSPVQDSLHLCGNYSIRPRPASAPTALRQGLAIARRSRARATAGGICCPAMSTQTVRLHRWDEIALEKVTEMLSRKVVTGEREMIAQIYLKRGCVVPMHSHESEQMTYILQGALRFHIGGEEITVREGEVLHIPSWIEHQAEALEDTFELDVFSPIRQDWIDHTDDYFHR
jgi:quercetin dioxygenase-like cupin family protein